MKYKKTTQMGNVEMAGELSYNLQILSLIGSFDCRSRNLSFNIKGIQNFREPRGLTYGGRNLLRLHIFSEVSYNWSIS